MAFVKVGSLSALPPGSVTKVTLGQESYAIYNSNSEPHALTGICRHTGGRPFRLNEKDGYFYGLGTQDMKSDAALLVTNFIRLKREGFRPCPGFDPGVDGG